MDAAHPRTRLTRRGGGLKMTSLPTAHPPTTPGGGVALMKISLIILNENSLRKWNCLLAANKLLSKSTVFSNTGERCDRAQRVAVQRQLLQPPAADTGLNRLQCFQSVAARGIRGRQIQADSSNFLGKKLFPKIFRKGDLSSGLTWSLNRADSRHTNPNRHPTPVIYN